MSACCGCSLVWCVPGLRLCTQPLTTSSRMPRRKQVAAQAEEGMLARMSLELLQEILVNLPLRARLQPAISAKFLWLAACSPMMADDQVAESSPLGALLPPPGLGAPLAWAAAPTNALHTNGHAIFPPPQAPKCSHWLLTGNTYTVVATPKGNPKTLKNFAVAGGGTGVLRGETKWSGLNYIRGVRIVDDMVLAPHSEVILVGCHIGGYIKQLANGSLTLIDCTLVRVSRSEQSGSSTLGMGNNMHSLGDPGVKVGNKGKLTMLGCHITGPRDKPDVAARNFSEINIQDCIFENALSSGNLSVGYQTYGAQVAETPAKFCLEGCLFKPVPLTQMGPGYVPPQAVEDDVFVRGSRSMWYTGAVAHEFRVRGNDFAGGLMFWQLHEGTMVLDNNTFHGPGAVQPYQAGTEDAANRRRSSSHVEVYVMDGETSTAVVHVRGAPSWLRHEARNGASIQTATD